MKNYHMIIKLLDKRSPYNISRLLVKYLFMHTYLINPLSIMYLFSGKYNKVYKGEQDKSNEWKH